jgi:hypothetical protein
MAQISCGPCNSTECKANMCPGSAPYFCFSGVDAGGCSATPAAFNDTVACTVCCDSSDCQIKPKFQCDGVRCPLSLCNSKLACDVATPYECIAGSDANGCSSDNNHWGEDPHCTACCDIRTCAAEKQCTSQCTAAQCANNTCTASVPYECTSGPLSGGCTANASYFPNNAQCGSCCDTTSCKVTPKFFCDNVVCPLSLCNSHQACGFLTPYECTAGAAAYGCSANNNYWGENPTCTACCDIRTCAAQKQCKPCSSEQCIGNQCLSDNPYACLSGPLAGACSASPSYFPDNNGCYLCCDASDCNNKVRLS